MTAGTTPMIDLAPMHKLGFVAKSPILLAAGVVGIGDRPIPGMDLQTLGGVVIGPVRRHPHGGAPLPRLAEAPGMLVLEVGSQNRGLKAILKRYARSWSRLAAPVIVQLADTEYGFLTKVAEELAQVDNVSAFELLCPPTMPNGESPQRWLEQAVSQLAACTDLPLWVKLPLDKVSVLGEIAVKHGAVGLVVGQSPTGTLPAQSPPLHPLYGAEANAAPLVRGVLYGPAVYPLMLTALIELAQRQLPAALIACGGIHTASQARQLLDSGAAALQIDSAAWIEPGLPQRLQRALAHE